MMKGSIVMKIIIACVLAWWFSWWVGHVPGLGGPFESFKQCEEIRKVMQRQADRSLGGGWIDECVSDK